MSKKAVLTRILLVDDHPICTATLAWSVAAPPPLKLPPLIGPTAPPNTFELK